MIREERELQRAFSIKEKHEKLLANLDALKARESTPDDLFNSMKTEYQQSMEQAIEAINRVKKKLAADIQAEEINIQRQNQELQTLNTRFKVGELTADNLQKAEQRIQRKVQRSQAHIEDLKRLQASQSSADVGGYIDTKVGTTGSSSISFATVSIPQMDHVLSAIRGTSITDFSEFRTDVNEILKSPLDLVGQIGGAILLISIFLPWFTVLGFSQSLVDVSGMSGAIGSIIMIELLIALVGIASVFLAQENGRGIVLMATGIIALVTAVILIPMLFDANVGSGIFFSVAGIGYYVNILATILMAVGGLMVLGR